MLFVFGFVVVLAGGVAGFLCLPLYPASFGVWGVTIVIAALLALIDESRTAAEAQRRRDRAISALLTDILYVQGSPDRWSETWQRRSAAAEAAEWNQTRDRTVRRLGFVLMLLALALGIAGAVFMAQGMKGAPPEAPTSRP